jgi:lysophospholipase L1-like esterase
MVRPLLAVLCAIVFVPAAARAADPGPYVSLGDSFTAGTLILNPVGTPLGCGRSDHNYPTIVRGAIGASQHRDVSCGAATTRHMTEPQPVRLGTNPPQFDALDESVRLVTVGIGGNDAQLVDAALKCLQLGLLAPTGQECRRHFAYPGGDALADGVDATAPKIAATLQGIHARSPQARVLIVGYPAVAPIGTNCYPLVPLSVDDMRYIDGMLRRTNAMIAAQAAANDAEFVDTYEESLGHHVCTPPGTRWFEGLVPTAPAFPVHPNALGEAGMARSVLRVLGSPRPAPALSALAASRRVVAVGRALRLTFTLTRAANVTLALQRSRGRGRYTSSRTLTTVDAAAGANAVKLTAKQLGRRAGLYRVSAALAGGAAQTVQFRIRRARSR